MKSHKIDFKITEKEAKSIAQREAYDVITRYNQYELPKIKLTYVKMFILAMASTKGIGKKRMREVMRNLAYASCDLHNLTIDEAFDYLYNKYLKENDVYDIYDEFSKMEIVPIWKGSKYVKVKESED